MRSDHIGRRPAPASTKIRLAAGQLSQRRMERGRFGALIALAAVVLLAGCNNGSMNEARQSQEFDAAETPRLAAQQSTWTAKSYFEPTGTPPPPTPLPPTLETLAITLGVGPDGAPSGSYLSIPTDAGTAYATGRLRDVRSGQKVSATWTDGFGNIVGSSEIAIAADAAEQWVAVPLQLDGGMVIGEYAVYLFGGGRQLGSLAFMITGPGSGAQLLPDPPANPQARGTTAPQPTQSGQQEQGGQQPQQQGGQTDGEWVQQADGTWQQQTTDQQQWNQPAQDQWNQQPADQWNQAPVEGQAPADWD